MPFDLQLKPKWCKHFSFNSRKRTVLWPTYMMTGWSGLGGATWARQAPPPSRSRKAMEHDPLRATGQSSPRRPRVSGCLGPPFRSRWGGGLEGVRGGSPRCHFGPLGNLSGTLIHLARVAHPARAAQPAHLARFAQLVHLGHSGNGNRAGGFSRRVCA